MLGAANCQWLSVSCSATERSTSRAVTSTALFKRLVPRPCIIDRLQHLRDRCWHLSADWRGGAMRCAVHFRRISLWLGQRMFGRSASRDSYSAIHRRDMTRDHPRLVGRQEHRHIGDVVRFDETYQMRRRDLRHSQIASLKPAAHADPSSSQPMPSRSPAPTGVRTPAPSIG